LVWSSCFDRRRGLAEEVTDAAHGGDELVRGLLAALGLRQCFDLVDPRGEQARFELQDLVGQLLPGVAGGRRYAAQLLARRGGLGRALDADRLNPLRPRGRAHRVAGGRIAAAAAAAAGKESQSD
jgi:hypothetical protein